MLGYENIGKEDRNIVIYVFIKKGFCMKNGHTSTHSHLIFGILCLVLAVLPGCWLTDWFKKETPPTTQKLEAPDDPLLAQGEQIVCMDGVCIISDRSLDHAFNQLLEEQPQLKSVLPLMPNAKENFLQSLISQAVVDRYVQENNIDKTAEYQKDFDSMMHSVTRMLNTKYFSTTDPIEITDLAVKLYYETNKTKMPDLLVSNGGVKAEGISFETEADAKNFAAAIKGKDFALVAKEQKLEGKIHDFKLIHEQSIGIHAKLKEKVLSIGSFPATEVIKTEEKTFWVVRATERQDPKYLPLEQVHAPLKEYMIKEERMKMLDEKITKLRNEYKITINEQYFTKQKEQQKVAVLPQVNREEVPHSSEQPVIATIA